MRSPGAGCGEQGKLQKGGGFEGEGGPIGLCPWSQ